MMQHFIRKHSTPTIVISDDYMKARQKARTAEETSDLASEFETDAIKRKRIQKVLSSSEESIVESILPSPPKRRIGIVF